MNLYQAPFTKRLFGCAILATGLLFSPLTCPAQTNGWTSSVSGNWQDSTWSLGIPPAASQSVMITNAGFKAVGIFPATAANFPATMTVSNLTISAPDNSDNVLLLNFFGTALPLEVLSNCTIGSNGTILSLYSGLQVDGELMVLDGNFTQEGGVTIATNAQFFGTVELTNATLLFSNATFGGTFVEDGGIVRGSNFFADGSFELDAGELSMLTMDTDTFNQYGGEIDTGFFSPGNYWLSNGVLNTGELFNDVGTFNQTGGRTTVSNGLFVEGLLQDYGPPFVGFCSLRGGFLGCGSLTVLPIGVFDQFGGTNDVSGNLLLYPNAGFDCFILWDGLLAVSNTIVTNSFDSVTGIITSFAQNGGVHQVTNALMCYGLTGNTSYELRGGTLVAPNILISGGEFSIGASPAAVISNRTSFALNGATLLLSNTFQSLAPLQFSGFQSEIDFVSGNSQLKFANSSGQFWTNGVTLAIAGWNGSESGGGLDQLFFGTGSNGLTAAQVQQIQFINPAGFAAGTWPAKILPTGEVVPTAVVPMSISVVGRSVVVRWPGQNFHLQVATNLLGPFEDLFVLSPYTNDITQFPQRFFRVAPPQ